MPLARQWSLFFTSAVSPMELPVIAMVLATILLVSERTSRAQSSVAAPGRRKLSCLRTFWCCEHAPRGWQLFHLLLPWMILLVLCLPCLSAMGESTEADSLHCSFHLPEDVAHATVGLTVIDGCKDVKVAFNGIGLNHSLSQKEFSPASCTLPCSSHLWQAFLNLAPQSNPSAEIIVQANSVQDRHIALILDWGSPRLNSGAFKVITLTNWQYNTELTLLRIPTSNTQFCAAYFQEEALLPGSRMSIPLLYKPDNIGKAQGSMILETSIGCLEMRNFGACTSSVTDINPASGLFVVSKIKLQETSFLVDSSPEVVTKEESYTGMEPTVHQVILCRRIPFILHYCNSSSFKVTPIAEWGVNGLSTRITDFSANVDDGEHLLGTLCPNIYQDCAQLSEGVVVPMRRQSFEVTIESNLLFDKAEEDLGENSERATCIWTALNWQLQSRDCLVRSQMTNLPAIVPTEVLDLECAALEKTGSQCWITYSWKVLHTGRVSCAMEAFVSTTELGHLKKMTKPAAMVSCSVPLQMLAKCDPEDVWGGISLTKHSDFAKDSLSHGRYRRSSVPYEVREMVEGFVNSCGSKLTCVHKSDCRPMQGMNDMTLFPTAALCSNGITPRLPHECLKIMLCLASVILVNLAELNGEIYVFDLLWLSVLCVESCCAGPGISTSHWYGACELNHSSVSALSSDKDASELGKVELKHQYLRQCCVVISSFFEDGFFTSQHVSMPGKLCQKDSGIVDFGDFEFASLCEEPASLLDLEFEDIEKMVSELCRNPAKSLMVEKYPRVCHSFFSSFSRYHKLVIKVSLLILCVVFVVLMRLSRRETFLTTETALQQSCTFTFLLQSFCLKTVHIKGIERLSNLRDAHRRFGGIDNMECPDGSCHEKGLLNALTRAAKSVSFIFRWVIDSQTTVLNVRVQIAQIPPADKDADCSRYSSPINEKNCSTGLNPAEKAGIYRSSSAVPAGIDYKSHVDQTGLEAFDESTSSLVGVSSAPVDISETACSIDGSEGFDLNFQVKGKKDKGRRKKKRSSMLGLKQEVDLMGQTASSSPPSSPASPATPLAHGSGSPFSQSESSSRSTRGASISGGGPQSHAFPSFSCRSSQNQFSGELLQLDVPRYRNCHKNFKKGTLQQGQNVASKLLSESSVKMNSPGKFPGKKSSPKDACTAENWAAVARRAIASKNGLGQGQESAASSSGLSVKGSKPVLLPSATFPQRGRSQQWSPRMPENGNLVYSDSVASPSLVSTSLVAPHARAPGSRTVGGNNETSSELSRGRAASQMNNSRNVCSNEFVYDIWGDHFAEFSRTRQPQSENANNAVGWDLPVSPRGARQFDSFTLVQGDGDVAAVNSISMRLSGEFSIFSQDAFYSPLQQKD